MDGETRVYTTETWGWWQQVLLDALSWAEAGPEGGTSGQRALLAKLEEVLERNRGRVAADVTELPAAKAALVSAALACGRANRELAKRVLIELPAFVPAEEADAISRSLGSDASDADSKRIAERARERILELQAVSIAFIREDSPSHMENAMGHALIPLGESRSGLDRVDEQSAGMAAAYIAGVGWLGTLWALHSWAGLGGWEWIPAVAAGPVATGLWVTPTATLRSRLLRVTGHGRVVGNVVDVVFTALAVTAVVGATVAVHLAYRHFFGP